MKKLSLILAALSLTFLFIGCGNNSYPSISNKDEVASFGHDGHIGIFHTLHNNKKTLALVNIEDHTVIGYITKYKDVQPYIYTIGEGEYTKLNYETNELTQSDSLNGFSQLDKEVFNKLNK